MVSPVERIRVQLKLARLYTVWLAGCTLVVCVLIASLTLSDYLPSSWTRLSLSGLVLFVSVAYFSERYRISLGNGMEISAAFLSYFLALATMGPLGSLIVAVLSQLHLVRRGEYERLACFVSGVALTTAGTAVVYWGVIDRLGGTGPARPISVAAAGLIAGIVFQLLNYVLFAPVALLRRGISPVRTWREGFQPFLPFHFFFLAISLGLIYIYRLYVTNNPEASELYRTLLVVLCLLPVLGLIYAFRAYAHQRELARHNARLALRNERLFLQAVKSQVTALDVKDDYTARHSAAVAQWATDIARHMALDQQKQNLTHLASLVHDVGKIGVPDEVLNYPGRLEGQAWSLIETHCQNGYKILKTIDQFGELAEVILYHHERYDGSGYPVGLRGERIPLISRIICVADAYSAMVSDRPYRKALPVEVAKAELRRHAGTQFDPVVVQHFLAVLEEHDLAYQRGAEADFDLEFSSDRFLRELPPESLVEAAEGVTVSSS